MSREASRSTRRAVHGVASSPAVAGFRPAGAALAVAAAFTLQPLALHAQPAGGTAIHGAMTTSTVGNTFIVKTMNGAGSNHSAIDWISFSVPGGTKTYFDQPGATSTSINRVTGNSRSEIMGGLGSNGLLVLVNRNGIAFGPNSSVDTAGFTASTLGMSREDAIAGRLLFSGGSGALSAEGGSRIVARQGDVVLIASNVSTQAQVVVESSGAAILAAGQKVEITGRGLEGIRMEVQAGNQALNLGTLKGDAVGIFAGTLRHSGIVNAQAVSAEGGRVVLQSTGGDTLVSGSVTAGGNAGKGGNVDVFGERVALLAGAAIDASGANGGGTVRVGGDYQGRNASVPNAKRTYVDANATIKADAIQKGDGGRVIVWSDEFTRTAGQISARGGALGGNGGFAEVSGKKQLEYTGFTDLRAPKGALGMLLLDPDDVTIRHSASAGVANGQAADRIFAPDTDGTIIFDANLNEQLKISNVQVTTSPSPTSSSGGGGQITLESSANVTWDTPSHFSLLADKGITLNGQIHASNAAASLHLQALHGDIVGNAGSVIDVPALAAFAANTGTSTGSGGKILLSGATQVGTFAAKADGVGAAVKVTGFTPKDGASEVTIGNVYNSWGSLAGIGGDGTNPVLVSLATSTGGLLIATSNIDGGSVSLATAAGGDIRMTGSSRIAAQDGPVTITSGRDIVVGATSSGSYSSSITAVGGGVSMEAVGGISIGAPEGASYSSTVWIEGGNGGPAGAVKGVKINAKGGDAYFSNGTYVYANYAPIDVDAKGSITGNAYFHTYTDNTGAGVLGTVDLDAADGDIHFNQISAGSYSSRGLDGAKVTLTAKNGMVSGNYIDTSGWYTYGATAGNAGEVKVEAKTGIAIGTILARGGDGYSETTSVETETGTTSTTVPGQGGKAGKVTLTTTAGNILVSSIYAYGGSSSGASAGNGGEVKLEAQTGIDIGTLDARGGNGGSYSTSVETETGTATTTVPGQGGKAGNVTLTTTAGDIFAETIYASGGASSGGSAIGGGAGDVTITAAGGKIQSASIGSNGGNATGSAANGGKVTLKADGDIVLNSFGEFAITADAGDSAEGVGGNGGTINLTAGGSILSGASGGSLEGLTISSSGSGGLSAIGGFGKMGLDTSGQVTGKRGGTVLLKAGTDVFVPVIEAYGGGSSTDTAGQPGGDGGKVEIHFGGTYSGEVLAYGAPGSQGSSTAMTGGAGGKGGSVWLERTGSTDPLTLDGSIQVHANGGLGGDAYFDEGGVSLGGLGGAGGSVTLSSAGGGVVLYGGLVRVAAGLAGYDATDSRNPAVSEMGQFVPLGNVQVQSTFELDGAWVNTATVDVMTESGVFGDGTFRNRGTLNLQDYSSMRANQVHNPGTINTSGPTEATITSNTGLINVQADSTLTTYDFVANAGTLKVNGTLDVQLPGCDCSLMAAAAISGPTFANNGSIIGNGNVMIAGGGGTLENFAVIAPGGIGPVGTLTITGNLVMAPGSALAVDLGAPGAPGTAGTSDLLVVDGNATTGGTVVASAASFDKGDMFTVMQAISFDGNMPAVNLPQLTPTFGPRSIDFSLVANALYPPLQTPEVNGQVVIFSQLFLQESERQQQQDKKENQIGKDDIVVTDTACKP